jgi:hypothetical protein
MPMNSICFSLMSMAWTNVLAYLVTSATKKKVLTPDGGRVGEQDEHGGHEQEDRDDGAGSNPAHLGIMKKMRFFNCHWRSRKLG